MMNKSQIIAENRKRRYECEQQQDVVVDYFPTRLKLEHTSRCNAECIMCSHYFTCNVHASDVSDLFQKKLLPILPFAERIMLQGSGEPFLHPHITQYIMEYAEAGIDVTCNTNLSVMNKELAEAIAYAFRTISVSCDGCTKDIYEQIRQNLKFDRFRENLRYLRTYCSSLKIKMYTILMRQNLNQIPDIVRFAADMGCDSLIFTDLNPKQILQNQYDQVCYFPDNIRNQLEKAVEVSQEVGIRLIYPTYLFHLSDQEDSQNENLLSERSLFPSRSFQKKLQAFYLSLHRHSLPSAAFSDTFHRTSGYHSRGICNYLVEEPYIDVNGNVFPCCGNGQYYIGNLYESDFISLWNHDFYQSMRKMFYNGDLPEYCKGCLYLRNHYLDDVRVLDADKSFFQQGFSAETEWILSQFKNFSDKWDATSEQ